MSQFVPKQFVAGFQSLRDLTDEEAKAVVAAVEALPTFSPMPAIVDTIRQSLSTRRQDEASGIVDSLLSLRGQLRAGDWSPEELARRVAETDNIMPADESERDILQERIERLIVSNGIATTTSAADLLIQHERPFRSARVFTDLRPVFADDVTAAPQGAVILENLQIEYWTKDGGRAVATFGLDEGDLRDLKDVVDRAILKTDTLRAFLESVGVSPFSVEGATKAAVDDREQEDATT